MEPRHQPASRPVCHGCELGELLTSDGYHEEDTSNADVVYRYPCKAIDRPFFGAARAAILAIAKAPIKPDIPIYIRR